MALSEPFIQNIKNYLSQQIEIYGDDFGLEKEVLTTKTESDSRLPDLDEFYNSIKNCQLCPLGQTRQNLVFGSGDKRADIMLIGEAPGADEDRIGEPFVGKAGQLLDKILNAIQLSRKDVYIANILKCRPPENRDPLPYEITECELLLHQQIKIIQPKLILVLGRIAAQTLLKTTQPLNRLRGKVHDYNNIKLIVTYHPAALLRYPQYKVQTWEDVKLLRKLYDEL